MSLKHKKDKHAKRITYLEAFNCCGLFELDGIDDMTPVEAVHTYWSTYTKEFGYGEDDAAPFVVFTSVHSNGPRLATYIRRHKLGKVLSCPPRYNSTGSPHLRAWVWLPVRAVGKVHDKQFDRHFRKEIGPNWREELYPW